MDVCVLNYEQEEAAFKTRLGPICRRCAGLIVGAIGEIAASAIWNLERTAPAPMPESPDSEYVKVIVDEYEAGRLKWKLPHPTAEACIWAAESYFDEGLRREAIREAGKAYGLAAGHAAERERAIEFLVRPELLRARTAEELRRQLFR